MKIGTNLKNFGLYQTIFRWSSNRFKLSKERVWIVSSNLYEDWYKSKNVDTYQLGQNLGQRTELNRIKDLRKNFESYQNDTNQNVFESFPT